MYYVFFQDATRLATPQQIPAASKEHAQDMAAAIVAMSPNTIAWVDQIAEDDDVVDFEFTPEGE